jgi:Ca2+-binding EF-hand superfamily protein
MDALPMAMDAVPTPRAPVYAAPTGAPSEKLKKFDRDGDGLLDPAEFAAAQRAIRREVGIAEATPAAEAADALRRRLFEQFDKNGDGRLDDGERTAAQTFVADGSLLRSPELRDEVLQRFDRNANNRIDPDERGAVVAFFQELRAQAAPAMTTATKPKAAAKAEAKAEAKREKKAAAPDPAAPIAAETESGKEKIAKDLVKRRQASVEAAARPVDTP